MKILISFFTFIFLSVICTSDARANKTYSPTDLPAHEQARLIATGELSSESLLKAYLARIEKMDRHGPRVQAIISINPDALAQAKEKDIQVREALQQNKALGKLHGLPVLVKDNIETSELPTSAGSLALKNNDTMRDAPIIAKLKAEGAIVLGKTNLSQWANFRDEDSISGWSAVGGQTRNPHSLDRTPCGSSSGSGAAIAAQFASLAIGTETNGSVICPATMNGIVGFKPSVGLLSRHLIVPISSTQDTAGPMTRFVKDAALMMSVMAGSDENDVSTTQADTFKQDYTSNIQQRLKGKRIGVLRATQSDHPQIIKSFNEALEVFKKQGAILVDIDEIDTPDDFWDKSLEVLLIEFKQELNNYLANTPDTVTTRTLSDLIAFNENNEREMSLFKQSLFVDAQATNGYNEDYHALVAFLREATRQNGIDKLLADNKLDVLVTPTQTPAFLIDSVYGDSFPGGFAGLGWMAAIAGYPHATVPMGDMKGLPIGLSVIAGQYQDDVALNVAYQYEQASKKLFKPNFAQSAIDHTFSKEAMTPSN